MRNVTVDRTSIGNDTACMLGSLKDSLASSAAKALLAGRIQRYGTLTELRIRSGEKTLAVEMLLAGEKEPIRIEVGRYRITGTSGAYQITLDNVTASREWIQLLLEDFVVGKSFAIPSLAIVGLGGPENG